MWLMQKTRLEAFSDGVLAIIITIMVLELKPPHGANLAVLYDLAPKFASYVLSFIYVAIYWANHHHMLHLTRRVTGGVLWANSHLLFWLSLVPFTTAWMGENGFAPIPTALYGANLILAAISYTILQGAIIRADGEDAPLASAVGSDVKGKMSLALYLCAIVIAFYFTPIAHAIYVIVALIWLVPDRRIEKLVRG
jgi:uncharacterized membrane protein